MKHKYRNFEFIILSPTYLSNHLGENPADDSNLCQDVKGPQTVAFNLPNDERIVKDRGTSMVMLKNVSEAKYIIFTESHNHYVPTFSILVAI